MNEAILRKIKSLLKKYQMIQAAHPQLVVLVVEVASLVWNVNAAYGALVGDLNGEDPRAEHRLRHSLEEDVTHPRTHPRPAIAAHLKGQRNCRGKSGNKNLK